MVNTYGSGTAGPILFSPAGKDEMAEKALEILKPKAEMLDGNMLIINFGISAR